MRRAEAEPKEVLCSHGDRTAPGSAIRPCVATMLRLSRASSRRARGRGWRAWYVGAFDLGWQALAISRSGIAPARSPAIISFDRKVVRASTTTSCGLQLTRNTTDTCERNSICRDSQSRLRSPQLETWRRGIANRGCECIVASVHDRPKHAPIVHKMVLGAKPAHTKDKLASCRRRPRSRAVRHPGK